MGNFFNRAAHFGIGFGIGLWAHRPGALVATTAFLGYQQAEQRAIHDAAYPEIREFGFGMACGLGVREAVKAYRTRPGVRAFVWRGLGAAATRAGIAHADTGVMAWWRKHEVTGVSGDDLRSRMVDEMAQEAGDDL